MVSLALVLTASLQSGLYHCAEKPALCDQRVEVHRIAEEIRLLRVEYVGDCGSMGPYDYPCMDGVCSDRNAEFTLSGPRSYHWRNLGYPFRCEFLLQTTPEPRRSTP